MTTTESRQLLCDTFRSVVLGETEEALVVQLLSDPSLSTQKEALASQCADVIWLLHFTMDKSPAVVSLLTKLVEKQIVSRSLVVERLPKELAAPLVFSAPVKPEVYLQKLVRVNTQAL